MNAGLRAKPLALLDALELQHNENRARRLDEIARRTDGGVPLDDGDGELQALGAFVPNERLRGITATAVVLSPERKRVLDNEHASALEDFLKATGRARGPTSNDVYAARKAYVKEAIAEIEGIGDADPIVAGDGKLPDDVLQKLDLAELIDPLFVVARRAQELPLGKG